MDLAVDNPAIYTDISCDERVPKSSQVKGMNKHLCHMYEILKGSCFFAIVFPENLQQNSNKFADGIPWNLHLQIYDLIGHSSMHA